MVNTDHVNRMRIDKEEEHLLKWYDEISIPSGSVGARSDYQLDNYDDFEEISNSNNIDFSSDKSLDDSENEHTSEKYSKLRIQ
ncbi:hypothetical protein FQA39_LY01586 [Lamprigera yunnana]|nr:hypothetical protein FQA39_LY01586 [Lamprigera yunnana]